MLRDTPPHTTDEAADDERNEGVSRRRYLQRSAGVAGVSGLGLSTLTDPAGANPVTEENAASGDGDWLPSAPGGQRPAGTHPQDVNHHVEGYPSRTGVEPGESLEFHISIAPAANYRIDVYRLGWYDGSGGRLMASLPEKQGEQRAIPDWDDETGLIECDWPVTDTLDVGENWTSGAYMAKFVATSGEFAGESTGYVFAVREPETSRTAAILFQLPNSTAQAYSGWGGKSLYGYTSAASRAKEDTGGWAADVISYDRPIAGAPSNHMRYSIHALRFLEREGYDVAYTTDDHVHRDPDQLKEYDLVVSGAHDEYWSRPQQLGFRDARDNGTNLVFLGSNTAYWQVRYEDDGRTMVAYKENAEDDPVQNQHNTDLFRNVGLPECELLGVMSVGAGLYNFPDYTVQEDGIDHPWMEGTGFEVGNTIVGCVGHEWAWIRDGCNVPGNLTTFFHYEAGSSDLWITNDEDADSVTYEAPSNARVFTTGTMGYAWRLDPDPTWNDVWPYNRVRNDKPAVLEPDERLQQFTRNALDDLRTVVARLRPSASRVTVGERISFDVEDRTGNDRWIDSLDWAFGDGSTGSGWWNDHRYDDPGTYVAMLTATDNTGHSTTRGVTITVADLTDPIAILQPSTTEADAGERITFGVEDTSGENRWIESLDWNFGDGTTGSGWWNAHTNDEEDAHTVTLTATDNTGHTTIDEVTINGDGELFYDGFEDGAVDGWVRNGGSTSFATTQDGVLYGEYAAEFEANGIDSNRSYRTTVAKSGTRPSSFSYAYSDTDSGESYGCAVRVRNSAGDVECSFVSNSPGWGVEDGTGVTHLGNGTYQWTDVTVEFDWPNGTFTVTFQEVDSGSTSATYTGELREGTDFGSIEVSNYNARKFDDISDDNSLARYDEFVVLDGAE